MNVLTLTVVLDDKTLARLAKSPLRGKNDEARVRKAFELVHGQSPEAVFACTVSDTVYEASVPAKAS